jgi:putative ABC transport system permease protein
MKMLSALTNVALQSLRYRFGGVLLTVLAVALSVFVLLGVEHVRQEAKSGFASTVSGVDLIVGARTGEINLLLLSIFRIGNATTNIEWETVEEIENLEKVSWSVPITLGDSHKNFRVVGTTQDFFERYQYGRKQPLVFEKGSEFEALQDVVLGSRAATELDYRLGDSLVLSHGMADTSFTHHDELPFNVVGILERSGTPIDNALFVSLEAIEAIHDDENGGSHEEHDEGHKGHEDHDEHESHDDHDEHAAHEHEEGHKGHEDHDEHESHDDHDEHDAHEHEEGHKGHEDHDEHESHDDHDEHDAHEHEEGHKGHEGHDEHEGHNHGPIGTVTALLVGLESPAFALQAQRAINEYQGEALLAILPGVALAQLWTLVGGIEGTLRGISILVFISSIFGLNAMLLASMRERRREVFVLRSIGAPSSFVLALLLLESLLIVTVGIAAAVIALFGAIAAVNGFLADQIGVTLSMAIFSEASLIAIGLIYISSILLSLLPAMQAYRASQNISWS